jgi:predicted dehydrogenase
MPTNRKWRMGMVGGGPGAFIGPVHKMAAELDGRIELVAGAFSQSAEKSRAAGEAFRIDPARAYASYEEMLKAEKDRKDPIDFVVIATPNNTHFPIAKASLEAGFAVMSDKPATMSYAEVLDLEKIIAETGLPYGLTHTYAGYSLVREARNLCRTNQLGTIRKVVAEYLQGWLSQPIEQTGQKQAAWRSDPKFNGPGGCIGDIGVHAFHLLEYVSGLRVSSLTATLRTVVRGRKLDDDCSAFLRLNNGAEGSLLASQIATGEGNGMRLRIYGENGAVDWHQEDPNRLHVKWADKPEEIRHAAAGYLSNDARSAARLPGGHPEGYIEAFAILYREFADALDAHHDGKPNPIPATLPGIEAAVRGMRFVELGIESSREQIWLDF